MTLLSLQHEWSGKSLSCLECRQYKYFIQSSLWFQRHSSTTGHLVNVERRIQNVSQYDKTSLLSSLI